MGINENILIVNETIIHTADNRDTFTSDEALFWHRWICHCFISQAICVFGTVANIINIVCFIKLGFKESVNVTLCGLAVSDLGSIVPMLWFNICMSPPVRAAGLPFDPDDMLYLTGGWPHIIFSRITSFLTAFLTLERCLCIAMPLKVKRIFTPRRVFIVVVTLFALLLPSISPIYYVTRLGMVFTPSRNKTILAAIKTKDRLSIYTVSVAVNNVILPVVAFAMVIICTATLVVSLHRKSKWRQSAAANSDQVSSRDQKVSKMVLTISTVFIICFVPSCMTFLVMAIEPAIDMYGRFRNTSVLMYGLYFTLESANSSVNIFIYYKMSSKFKAKLRELLSMPSN